MALLKGFAWELRHYHWLCIRRLYCYSNFLSVFGFAQREWEKLVAGLGSAIFESDKSLLQIQDQDGARPVLVKPRLDKVSGTTKRKRSENFYMGSLLRRPTWFCKYCMHWDIFRHYLHKHQYDPGREEIKFRSGIILNFQEIRHDRKWIDLANNNAL